MTISDHIATIHARAAEMDALIGQFRTAKTAMDNAEKQIRQLRPVSDPSTVYQERLSHVAIDAMGRPSLEGLPPITELAVIAWGVPAGVQEPAE